MTERPIAPTAPAEPAAPPLPPPGRIKALWKAAQCKAYAGLALAWLDGYRARDREIESERTNDDRT